MSSSSLLSNLITNKFLSLKNNNENLVNKNFIINENDKYINNDIYVIVNTSNGFEKIDGITLQLIFNKIYNINNHEKLINFTGELIGSKDGELDPQTIQGFYDGNINYGQIYQFPENNISIGTFYFKDNYIVFSYVEPTKNLSYITVMYKSI